MSPVKYSLETEEGKRFFREALKNLSVSKKISAEAIIESSDGKGKQEASAIANKNYEKIIEDERKKAETQTIIEGNLDSSANRALRWKYATWVFGYLVCYSIFVAVIMVLSAFNICGFNLESSVLEFLVGSTAASAIGLVYAVTHGLFNK